MKRPTYPAAVLAAGMAATHLLFTFFIYRSDLALHAKIIALKSAGFLVVPNDHILPTLTQVFPAFCGALFFSLTLGAGLTLLTFIVMWAYRRLFADNPLFLIFPAFFWIGLLLAVNAGGWNPAATAVFVIVPSIVIYLCRRWMPPRKMPRDAYAWITHVAVILIVALAWVPRLDGNVFINVRDYLLLENTAGQAVNSFYYQYTLYPAELFKTLDQKLLKTACIQADDPDISQKLLNELAVYDFLPVSGTVPCDLKVIGDEKRLVMTNERGVSVETDLATFLSESKNALREISEASDRNSFLRSFTFFSLVVGFPLSLYVFVHALFSAFLFLIPPVFLRSVIASLILMGIGVGAVIPLYGTPAETLTPAEIREKVAVSDWRAQRDGLKAMADQGIDPMRLAIDPRLMESAHVPVRYWLANSLGNSRSMEARRMLARLVDDPHPNVACMAYYGLGRSGSARTAEEIRDRMDAISHWYVQWYAYKALKKLGWTQHLSDTPADR